MSEENKIHPSQGLKRGPKRHDRWTFWQSGMGEGKPIFCEFCGERTYEAELRDSKWFCKDKNCYNKYLNKLNEKKDNV